MPISQHRCRVKKALGQGALPMPIPQHRCRVKKALLGQGHYQNKGA
jgi:hypothetical protein